MILNSITLENFKSHKYSHIDLDKGITLILGENGAGKSTIFEAISYAFFKEFTGKIDDVKRQSNNEMDIVKEMKVTIEFEKSGKHYKLIRSKKSNSSAELMTWENDKFGMLCKGDKQVTQELQRILELDSKSFLNAVYIRQGDITELIEKTAAEKKEFIGKLLNIDSVQKAHDELKGIIDKYNDEKNKNDGKLSEKIKIEENIEELNLNLKKNKETLNTLSTEQSIIETAFNKLKEEMQVSDDNKSRYNAKMSELKQQKKIIHTFEEQKKTINTKLQEIEKYEEECKKLKKYVEKLPYLEDFKNLKIELDKLGDKIKSINEQIVKIEKNKQIVNENKKFYDDYDKVQKDIEALTENRKKLEYKVKENQKINVKLSESQKRKDENLKYIRKRSDIASELFGKNFNNPEEVEKKVLEEKEISKEKAEQITKKINANNEELSVIKNELSNTKKSLKDLENTQDTCPICQSSISHEKHVELSEKYHESIISFEKRINELTNENTNQTEEIEKINQYLKDIDKIDLSLLKEKYDEFNELCIEIKSLKKLIPEIEKDENDLKNIDEKINNQNEHMKGIENKRQDYLLAKKTIEDLKDLDELNNEKNEYLNSFEKIKKECRYMMEKYAIKDDIDRTIKYTKKQADLYNEYQGAIKDKDNTLKEKESINDNLTIEQDNLKNITEEINNIDYDDEKNKKIHEDYTSNEKKLKEKELSLAGMSVNIKKDEEQLEKYREELEELKELSKEQNNLKDYLKFLNDIRDFYGKDGVQKILRDQAKPKIEKATIDIFNEFDFNYSSLKLDSNYDIKIETKDGDRELNLMSGGEKIVIALALRLGIARVVSKNKTELLLLDEPTIHLDAERRASLIDTINSISIVPQMIIVTHDDEMEPIANKIVKVVKQNGISSIDNS